MTLIKYYLCLISFLRDTPLKECKYFKESLIAQTQIYTFYLNIKYFQTKHYRHSTFKKDLVLNLKNVFIPYTYIKFSYFVLNYALLYIFFFIIFPIICMFDRGLYKQLTDPKDWFTFWRINSIVNYHNWLKVSKVKQNQYENEDKYIFYKNCCSNEIPTIPLIENDSIIVKHKNREGGLSLFKFSNAVDNGNWIIQEKLENNSNLKPLLFKNSPLSTYRIITNNNGKVLSCVLRVGLNNAKTDHKSLLYPISLKNKKFKKSFSNHIWYNYENSNVKHNIYNKDVNNLQEILDLAKKSHSKLLPDIPLAGWDIAYTEKYGLVVVEVNISCNFFCGIFDKTKYFKHVYDVLTNK